MILVTVCVYDRFENLKHWINCWQKCDRSIGELIILHNYYGDEALKNKFQNYCAEKDIRYIPRNGAGFDIGAFQDVCKERLKGFPEWDRLLWCTDDTFPMSLNFIHKFNK
ncbi:MAG: hypothetical protein AABY22_24485, partial [Nanoarchaeota archaeon]